MSALQKRLKKLSFVFLLVMGIEGCVPSDAIVWLTGTITDERQRPYAECVATMFSRSGELLDERPFLIGAASSERRRIQPLPGSNFIVDLIFSSFAQPAVVSFSCDGSTQKFGWTFEESVSTPAKPINLGHIVLQRRS